MQVLVDCGTPGMNRYVCSLDLAKLAQLATYVQSVCVDSQEHPFVFSIEFGRLQVGVGAYSVTGDVS